LDARFFVLNREKLLRNRDGNSLPLIIPLKKIAYRIFLWRESEELNFSISILSSYQAQLNGVSDYYNQSVKPALFKRQQILISLL